MRKWVALVSLGIPKERNDSDVLYCRSSHAGWSSTDSFYAIWFLSKSLSTFPEGLEWLVGQVDCLEHFSEKLMFFGLIDEFLSYFLVEVEEVGVVWLYSSHLFFISLLIIMNSLTYPYLPVSYLKEIIYLKVDLVEW